MSSVEPVSVDVPDQAIIAWRYWQLSSKGLLRAVSHRRMEWPVGTPLRAVCVGGGHRAPAEGCACGVYGAPDLETLRQHGLCLAPEPLVAGEVALWGTTFADEGGIRAEFGYPRTLAVVPETVPGAGLGAVTDTLRAYGVPVDHMVLEAAVAGVSAAMLRFQAMSEKASRTRVP